jgi:hypothetical protein
MAWLADAPRCHLRHSEANLEAFREHALGDSNMPAISLVKTFLGSWERFPT